MRYIKVDTVRGVQLEKLYDIDELECVTKMYACKESKRRGVTYLEIPCAFDIETTNIYQKDERGNIDSTVFRPYSFMYHWQFCIEDQVCFGRTWQEFKHLLDRLELKMNLNTNNRLVIFCHNLNFEFQFFRRFVTVVDGFYKEPYKPLKVVLNNGIEFRDSYALSNMSLQKFCENERGVLHYKLSGEDYDYRKIRTAATVLTPEEEAYCYNDVRGLAECIASRMQDDTLATMPMTSTGYVRRDCRNAVRKNRKNREKFLTMRLDENLYRICREAFRGGDTHANLRHSGQILHDVYSFDIQSSYPAAMLLKRYPSTAFFPITVKNLEERDLTDFALLFRVRLFDVKYIGTCGIPYISQSKCVFIDKDAVIDNGRVLSAAYVQITVTDIDWKIIQSEYTYTDIYYKDIYASRYDYLPIEFRNVIMDYYKAKTELKGIKAKVYEYNKSKNKLNSCYGMQVMRIDQTMTHYKNGEYEEDAQPLSDLLDRYYKSRNSFLSYQQGVWVTCHARKQLRDMLNVVGKDVVYCDTDSIKFIGDHHIKDFEAINEKLKDQALDAGAYAEDAAGIVRPVGIWDYEGKYEEFKTLGAKKYAYTQDGELHSVIAGVNKKVGSKYFGAKGLEAFEIGEVIEDSGHLTAFYNDDDIHTITVDGCTMETASNVALVDNTYTIGVTGEYFLLLLEQALDKQMDMMYI